MLEQKVKTSLFRVFGGQGSGRALAVRKELAVSQYWPRAEIDTYQRTRLMELLDIAVQSCPYYRRLIHDPLKSDGVSAREVLAQLPLLYKADVRRHWTELQTRRRDIVRLQCFQTGGSTGEPLRVCKDRRGLAEVSASILRGHSWAELQLGDRTASIKAHGRVSRLGKLRQALLNAVSFSSCADQGVLRAEVIPALKQFRPRCITGYPTSLLGLASELRPREIVIPIILVTGEMLFQHQRTTLEDVFGGQVFQYYGSNEVSGIAFQCNKGALHVTDEQVIVEILDEAGQQVWDRVGRIVLTDLRNVGMPLIRYEIGDLGSITREICECGRTLTVIKELQGRTQDVIIGDNGVQLSGVFFAGRFRDLKYVRSYQLVQKDPTLVQLNYVPAGDGADAEISSMIRAIGEKLGCTVVVQPVPCDELSLTRAGKTRLVVGLVGGPAPI
ncbi:phenylacetate-CoA ligase [Thiocapsa rosea]|uniref:Phenylacetate-CoA ligase n=1 Tax=Thiocapsa rosea TaxID=69360 RepID=A0A495V8G3_9GAMM|nr:phenylacetate-CoA ligase [Thiocapsa rosea]